MAISAQGLAGPRPTGRAGLPQLRKVASRLGAIQVDSVNVLIRSQYLPMFSRLGPYPKRSLDRLAGERRALFEYLGHAASLLPIELHPLLRWRMDLFADKQWSGLRARIESDRPGYVAAIEREVAERGPLAFSDLTDPGRRERVATKYADSTIAWWRWSHGKDVLEGLFRIGRLAVAGRSGGFERLYDLSERVIPDEVRAAPTPPEAEAKRALVRIAARALGVATVRDLADYFRLSVAETRARVWELVDEGVLRPARVEGWRDQAFVDPDARAPESEARALVSPFDSLVWDRARTECLFGFRYRIEIYVPEAKRQHGYYVLPFLLGEALAARVDLKADRSRGALLVPGAFVEPGSDPGLVASELAGHLGAVASWLALDRIEVGTRGELARRLAKAVKGRR
jgi:uncharacterized protein YcaQ